MSVLVVNMIPQALSGERNSDSEPFIAVNPVNPTQIAASAFTPDPIPNGSTAPIYISSDGGQTWTLHSVLPIAELIPSDITLRFAPGTSRLYAAILDGGLTLKVLRSADPDLLMPMSVIKDGPGADQPYIHAATVGSGPSAGEDRIYVGRGHATDAPGQGFIAVDVSLDASTPSPVFVSAYPEARGLSDGVTSDGWQVRSASHADGKVYVVFYSWRGTSGGKWLAWVVVCRDDDWGVSASPAPFTDLKDPSDGKPGRYVTSMPVTYSDGAEMGQERLGGELAIAVDPRDSSIVYVAWADQQGTGPYTLHIRGSSNAGQDWSGDLRTIPNAQNPALAVNSRGKIAFLYQQLTDTPAGQRWETHLQRSVDTVGWQDTVLATMPADAPAGDSLIGTYLGDYLSLMAVGKDFYGVFSMSNLPDFGNYLDNFPQDVVYQRNKDFDSQPHALLDLDGTTPVPSSIDPFFVKVIEVEPEHDVYVRDWTDDESNHDLGVEPSAHDDLFTTSDVWNQWTSDSALPFISGKPPHEAPQPAVLGDNFAFVRVSRNVAKNTPVHVDAQFLYADFGLAPFATLPGGGPAVGIDLGPDDLQGMSAGLMWQLPASTSPHIAMAVQVSTPDDPMLTPGLFGKDPGSSTDASVSLDNNKALRDVAVYQVIPDIEQVFFAAVHCLPPCDLSLVFDPGGPVEKGGYIELIDGRRNPRRYPLRGGAVLNFERMQPAENRWIGVVMTAGAQPVQASFTALRGHLRVGGFAIVAEPAPLTSVLHANVRFHAGVFSRLGVLPIAGANEESGAMVELLRAGELSGADYINYLRTHAGQVQRQVREVLEREESAWVRTPHALRDPFGLLGALARFNAGVRSENPMRAAGTHGPLLHRLDAFLTMVFKSQSGEVPARAESR
jgi:hypothetical protein